MYILNVDFQFLSEFLPVYSKKNSYNLVFFSVFSLIISGKESNIWEELHINKFYSSVLFPVLFSMQANKCLDLS